MNIGGVLNDLMFDCIRKVMSRISYYYVYIYGMECLLINLTKFIISCIIRALEVTHIVNCPIVHLVFKLHNGI